MNFNWPIVGHKKIVKFLQKTIENGKTSHAHLFYGPENLGKKSMAKLFSQSLICEKNAINKVDGKNVGSIVDTANVKVPCGECSACQGFLRNIHPDVIWLRKEEEKKNISIDQIRDLKEKIGLSGFTNGYKIVIIVNAEEMTNEAANSFLKILEEPPQKSVIIILANKLRHIPETIVSRCQAIKFAPVKKNEIIEFIKKEYKLNQNQAGEIAAMAFGLPGRANKFLKNKDLLDDFIKNQNLFIKILESDIGQRLKIAKEVAENEELGKIILCWKTLIRDLMFLKTGNEDLIVNLPLKSKIKKIAEKYNFEKIYFSVQAIDNLFFYLDQNINARLALDNFVINL